MADSTTATEPLDSEFMSSGGSVEPPLKKKQRMNGPKTCRVCGDRALAHNFDVVSCESCKAFFRRNALKAKIKPCAFNGDCDITSETRRFCSHCRLKKCLLRGMKPDMILDKDERKARQDKLTQNRLKRQQAKQTQQPPQQQQPQLPQTQIQPSSPLVESLSLPPTDASLGLEPNSTDTGEWVIPVKPVNRNLRGSLVRSEFLQKAQSQATLLDFSVLIPQETTLNAHEVDIDMTFQHVPKDQLPTDVNKFWHLKEEERVLLSTLTAAYQDTVLKLPETIDLIKPVNLQTILSRCQRVATDIINFVKKVPDFRALGMKDQVAVLKGASWRTFLVKSSANFIVDLDGWIKDNGYLSVDQFTEASPEHRDRILLLARYSTALKHIIQNDPTTFAVLQMMVLFDPRDPNIIDRQLVSEMADKYALLLKHLLQSKWSYDHAGHYLEAVRGKLQEMSWVAQNIQAMFMDWLDLLEPLMREVLNLN